MISQTGALNTQEELKAKLIELKAAKSFIDMIVEQVSDLEYGTREWYTSNFGRYIHLHGRENFEIFEVKNALKTGGKSFYYTSPLIDSYEDAEEMRTEEQKANKIMCAGLTYFLKFFLT